MVNVLKAVFIDWENGLTHPFGPATERVGMSFLVSQFCMAYLEIMC